MSLNFNLEGIENYKEKCWLEMTNGGFKVHPLTDTLIWTSVFIGLNEITKANINEWVKRVKMYEHVMGALRVKEGKDVPLTQEEIESHIGLWTNATKKTKTMFNKQVAAWVEQKALEG